VILASKDETEAVFGILYLLSLVVIAVALFLLYFVRKYWRNRAVSGKTLPAFASQVGGEIAREQESSEFPFVRFDRNGARWYYMQWTTVNWDVVVTTLECKVGAESLFEASSWRMKRNRNILPRATGMPNVGDYRIRSTDSAWAASALERGLVDWLLEFQRVARGPARVFLNPNRLTMEAKRTIAPKEFPAWLDLMDRLRPLVALQLKPEEVPVIESVVVSGEGRCQVCGAALSDPVIRCARCDTPTTKIAGRISGDAVPSGARERRPAEPSLNSDA
jgi:hypothetical protein